MLFDAAFGGTRPRINDQVLQRRLLLETLAKRTVYAEAFPTASFWCANTSWALPYRQWSWYMLLERLPILFLQMPQAGHAVPIPPLKAKYFTPCLLLGGSGGSLASN
jgi:hypothetical protein